MAQPSPQEVAEALQGIASVATEKNALEFTKHLRTRFPEMQLRDAYCYTDLFLKNGAEGILADPIMDEVLETLKKESALREKRRKWKLGIFSLFVVGLVLAQAWLFQATGQFGVCDSLLIAAAAWILSQGVSASMRLAAAAAARMKDKRALPLLLRVLDSGDKELLAVTREAILDILDNLESRDTPLFTERAFEQLHNWLLDTRSDSEATRILEALRKVGGPESMTALQLAGEGRLAVKGDKKDAVASLAKMVSADIRLRLSKEIIDKELEKTQLIRAVIAALPHGEEPTEISEA